MSEAQVGVLAVDIDVPVEVRNIIETLIFACDEPMTVRMIRGIIDEANKERLPHEQLTVNAEIIRKAVGDLNRGYGRLGSGFRIIEIAGGFVYATQEQFAAWVGKLAKEKARRRLSPTAVETLAIIAYKQPITKGEVEFIRGVNVDYIINALLEKDLISITGRQNSPGRPLLYGTTQKFLEHFGLNELTDLPKPREIAELINETELEVDRRLLAEQQELEFRESLENKLEGHEGTAKKEKSPKQPKKLSQMMRGDGAITAGDSSGGSAKKSELQTDRDGPHDSHDRMPVAATIDSSSVGDPVAGGIIEENTESHHAALVDGEQPPGKFDQADVELVVLPDAASGDGSEIPGIGIQPGHGTAKIEKVFDEEGAELSIRQDTIDEPNQPVSRNIGTGIDSRSEGDQESHRPSGEQSGWSTWKNKVKTFFKKLFG